MQVRRRCSGRPLSLLCNIGFPPGWLLRSAYGLSPSKIAPADLIVSAGAETLGASIAISRLTGAPNIFYGTLRSYSQEALRLVLTSYPSHANRPRHVMVLKPSALSLEALACRPDRLLPGAVPHTLGLLIGGDSGECWFAAEDWAKLMDFIEHSHRALGVRWVISNSRRTPACVSDDIATRAAVGTAAIAAFIDVRRAGHGTLRGVLEQAQAIVCTDDSSTMISECISAGLAVVGVRPRRTVLKPGEQGYRSYLSDNGWYRSVAISDLAPGRLLDELARIRPLTEDPLDQLAGVVRENLPELFAA